VVEATVESMTKNTVETLNVLKRDIYKSQATQREWTLFGSASLVVNGVLDREPGDIDVFVSRRLWGALLPLRDYHVETPNAGDPPILVNDVTPITIHLFFDWSDKYVDMDVKDLLRRSTFVETDKVGFLRVIPVKDALAHKKHAMSYGSKAVEKHIPDIAIIEEWLAKHSKNV
jgi:hypothetical protein